MVRFLEWAVPGRSFKEKPRLTDLDVLILETPLLAIEQSRKEIVKMGDGCMKMMDWVLQLMNEDDPDKALGDRLKQREQVLDTVQDEVAEFITGLLSSGSVSHATAEEARRQLRVADEYESISDYIANLDKFDRKLRRDGFRFSEAQRADLTQLNRHVAEYVASVHEGLSTDNPNVSTATDPAAKRIRDEVKSLRRKHLEALSADPMEPVVSVAFLAALNAYIRVRDHAQNVAETVAPDK